ncbi:hypothetical protein [Streptomyces ipomoeae]|uniref:hypothetical protein n=1 Tax=Streptomyces ipomoeae TaxID=103232 RepID=UPI0011465D40|nr:hypothetical protein [Streptomyces ipomoeae]TQE33109.1 hypothetical protein Sipo7851_21665 [Streptomyces ipomoeae]
MATPGNGIEHADADSRQIFDALAHGVAGHDDTAMGLLEPIVRRSDQAMFATICTLAEAASFDARQQATPGEQFGIQVENVDTGGEANVNVLPPGIRFAVQFVTAWANRDRATAEALYQSLYGTSPEDLGVGLRAIYEMAVVSLRGLVERRGGSAA